MNSRLLLRTVLCLLLSGTACLSNAQTKPSAEIHPDIEAVYPRFREDASPKGDKIVGINPVPLLWKAGPKGSRYKVVLSNREDFTDYIHESQIIPWAMFSPYLPLAEGRWFWKYYTFYGDETSVSETYSFIVTPQAKVFKTPSLYDFIELCRTGHPRLYVTNDEIPAFRKRNLHSPDGIGTIAKADALLHLTLPDDTPTQPRDTTGLKGFEMDMMLVFMYHLYGDKIKEPVEYGTLAYLLTGEDKYIDMAVRHALHIAEMDPKGHPTSEDFNSASAMLAMAQAYDTAYDRLDQAQRAKLLTAIRTRATHIYKNTLAGRFETQVMDNHIWQHVLRRFFMTACAVLGDIPEADEWLGYCYEVWKCRFPIIGGSDGGAPDGNSYFPVNFETFIYMPFIFERLSGVNFFGHEWYKNVAYYMLYSFPPHSISTQFGDEHEFMRSRPERYFGFIDAIARETGNPLMNWYLLQWLGGDTSKLYDDGMFSLYRMLTDKPLLGAGVETPEALPHSRVFKDIGVSVMRTDLTDCHKDLMVSFISAPFGATGHAHANHNSFSVNYGGEAMFGSSGYYSHFSDKHNLLHYRNSHGHNTVIADGLSQRIGENGYGWIARFAERPGFSYVLGDATNAYGEVTSPFWIDRMNKVGIKPSEEFGFGDPGIKRFRRHLMLLEPSLVVIYDELEATNPVTWEYMTHSPNPIVLSNKFTAEGNMLAFYGMNPKGQSSVVIFSGDDLELSVTDQFNEPAVNWRSLTDHSTGEVLAFPLQWHAFVTNKEKTSKLYLLTIMSFGDKPQQPTISKNGEIHIGEWSVNAELDALQQPKLSVYNRSGDGIYYNYDNVKGHETLYSMSTCIVDKSGVEEITDSLPESMK